MIIELLAIETTGLDPTVDRIVEWCVGAYDTESGRVSGDSGTLLPDAAMSDDVIAMHMRTGLLAVMAANAPKPLPSPRLGGRRIIWARDFSANFLPPEWSAGALDGRQLVTLGRMLSKAPQDDPIGRAESKVKFMAGILGMLA
jgi:hypothetical protein